jgi:hypothetical protein
MKFLVQIQDSPSTRWLETPEQLARQIELLMQSVLVVNTAGPLPSVTVIQDECGCPPSEARQPDAVRG